MKKIGFVNFDMSVRGGAQQVLYNMALALRKEYEITIISFIQENETCAYELPEDIHYEVILPYKARIREVITKAGKPFRCSIKKKDLDIVFYDDEIVAESELIIPHIDMQNRLFVLEPLYMLCPGKVHPVLHKTVAQLRQELISKTQNKWSNE